MPHTFLLAFITHVRQVPWVMKELLPRTSWHQAFCEFSEWGKLTELPSSNCSYQRVFNIDHKMLNNKAAEVT